MKGIMLWRRPAALLACALFAAQAQDEPRSPVGPPVQPLPAEILPLAPTRLVLDVTDTGRHLIAVGERGHILVSNDGAQWAQVAAPVRATLTAVDFADPDRGWAVGHDATILHTADGGRSWQLQNFEPELEKPFHDVLFVSASRGYAVGAYGLFYVTEDGGASWHDLGAGTIQAEELHFNALARLATGELLVVGETGMLGISADGRRWTRLKSPYAGSLFGALAYGKKGAVVFGLRGNVFVTEDLRGGRWRALDTGTVASYFGGALLPDGRVALTGLEGTLAVVDPRTGATQLGNIGVSASQSAALVWRDGLLLAGGAGLRRVGFKR